MIARTRGKLVVPSSTMLTGVDPKAVATVNMASLERALMMMNRPQRNDEPQGPFNRFNRVYLETEVNVA